MATSIHWPEVEVELSDREVDALRAELDALASTPKFAPEMRDRFGRGDVVDRELLTSQQLLTLLRALDHMRNARQLGEGGCRVRDALAAAGIGYKLEIDGVVQAADFISYGGMYDARDRLVAASGEVFRVTARPRRRGRFPPRGRAQLAVARRPPAPPSPSTSAARMTVLIHAL